MVSELGSPYPKCPRHGFGARFALHLVRGMVSELGSSHLNVRGTVSELGSPSPTVGCTFLRGGGGTKLSIKGLTQKT